MSVRASAVLSAVVVLISQGAITGQECPCPGTCGYTLEIVVPCDPNDKTGPYGVGDERFVSRIDDWYTIHFENVAQAAVPAQVVQIVDFLDVAFNEDCIEFGEVAFGDQVVGDLSGTAGGSVVTPLLGSPYLVNIEARVDSTQHTVFWQLTTIDPITGDLPEDVYAGFLPPNDDHGSGEGHVTVRLCTDELPSGTVVSNAASITFDTNAPILTPIWMNTIDNLPPTSAVTVAANETGGPLHWKVGWNAEDDVGGSGVGNVTVYVSVDGQPFVPWLQSTDGFQQEGLLRGECGSSYHFCSQATDRAGNAEPAPSATCLGMAIVDPGEWDADGDGVSLCSGDCDDNDALIYPGQAEECDGVDNDCDGVVDTVGGVDADGDGHAASSSCGEPSDCDDGDDRRFPGNTELCDGIDNDCDGNVDEGFLVGEGCTVGSGDCLASGVTVCSPYGGTTVCEATLVIPSQELCDGGDNDCDGAIDEGFDLDLDGFTTCGGDCNDSDGAVNPAAEELCDGIDNDCDAVVDEEMIPPVVECPANRTLTCNADTSPGFTGVASATDNCGGAFVDYSDARTPQCGVTETVTRTWVALDAAGNLSSCDQELATTDTTAPTLASTPSDIAVGCSAVPVAESIEAVDDCDSQIAVNFSEVSSGGTCADGYTLTRTWIATDDCGNAATHIQIITVTNTPPVALPDVASTGEDTSLTLPGSDLTANDSDEDGHNLTLIGVTPSVDTHGALVLADGVITYTPDPNFNGTATFGYEVGDGNNGSASAIVTVTVTPVNDAPAIAAEPVSQTVQYSDPIAEVAITGVDVDSSTLVITTQWRRNGAAAEAGLPAGLALSAGECGIGSPPVSCSWTVSGNIQEEPGAYDVTMSVVDDGELTDTTQLGASATFTINVEPEDARSYYTGPSLVWTPSVNDGTATLTLMATIQDISSATMDPATDFDAGDIRNATVAFHDDTGQVLCEAAHVDLVIAADTTLGSASCDWSVTLSNNEDARPIEVTIVVGNYYADTSDNETVIVVSRPGDGFITGGGYLVMSNSTGLYAGGVGTKTNYGFKASATELNNGKVQLKGRTTIIVRSEDGRKFKIRSNALLSLGVDPDPDGDGNAEVEPHAAQFEAKANLIDVTDPFNPISLGGNLLLQMRLTDNGEPGETDSISFTLWDGGELLFSSHWDGVQSVEQLVGGGNLTVH